MTDRIGHPLPEALTGVEIAGTHLPVGNTIGTESRRLNSPGWVRPDGCTASPAGAWQSSLTGADFVGPAGAGQWLGKTRRPAGIGRNTGAAAAPICGETHGAESDVAALVRTTFVMSTWAGRRENWRTLLVPLVQLLKTCPEPADLGLGILSSSSFIVCPGDCVMSSSGFLLGTSRLLLVTEQIALCRGVE